MKIEDAIKRYESWAEDDRIDVLIRKEHRQIADWLKELKADRLKHYCVECKYEPIDKRCMPCSSCTNNPKNRDAFVSREYERRNDE